MIRTEAPLRQNSVSTVYCIALFVLFVIPLAAQDLSPFPPAPLPSPLHAATQESSLERRAMPLNGSTPNKTPLLQSLDFDKTAIDTVLSVRRSYIVNAFNRDLMDGISIEHPASEWWTRPHYSPP